MGLLEKKSCAESFKNECWGGGRQNGELSRSLAFTKSLNIETKNAVWDRLGEVGLIFLYCLS